MVLHLDGDAVVAAAGEVPDPVGHFLVRHARVGPHGLLDRFGHRDVDGCVRPDLVHGELEPGRARGRLRNLRRKRHAAEVLVVRVPDLDWQVTDHGVRDDCLDLIDEISLGERRPRTKPIRDGERDRAALDRRVVFHRGLDDPVRSGPQLELALSQSDWRRRSRVSDHVPGVVSAHHPDLSRRRCATAARLRPSPLEIGPDRGGLVADRAGIAPESELGAALTRDGALADVEHRAGGRVLEGGKARCSHSSSGAFEGGSRVLRVAGHRDDEQQQGHQRRDNRLHARSPRVTGWSVDECEISFEVWQTLAGASHRVNRSASGFNAFGTKPTGRCVAGRLADDLPAVWAVALQRRHVAGIEARLEHAERRQAEIAGWELYGARLLRVARQEARGSRSKVCTNASARPLLCGL